MFTPPSVNQITSAYTGRMPQLAQRVEADKKAHGGIPQDLRQLLALNDMTQNGNNAGIQAALQQPTNIPTVAQSVQERARQAIQTKQTQAAQQQKAMQDAMQQIRPQGIPAGLPSPQEQPKEQGIDQLPANVGEYAHGGIIGYAGENGSYVDERDTLRRIEAAAYDQTNPVANNQTAEEIISQAMRVNETQKRQEAEARRGAITRDTSSMDELMADYKAQRERLKPTEPGYDRFMEFIGNIAEAPRGMGNLSAGAYGGRRLQEQDLAREAKRNELTKQMLEVGQKKADLGYQQKMDVFGAGESAEAAAIKDKYAAAINRSSNDMEKQRLAQQMDLELKKLAQQKDLEMRKIGADNARTAAMNKPETYQNIYAELQRLNPTASKAELLSQATVYAGINRTESVDVQILKQVNDEVKQLDAAQEKLNFVKMTDPEQYKLAKNEIDKRRANAEAMRAQLVARSGMGQGLPALAEQNTSKTGDSYTVSAGGKTYSFPNAEAAAQFKRDAGVK